MFKSISFFLILTLSFSSHANELFGGILLDSSLPKSHMRTIQDDFKYLFNLNSKNTDSEFKSMTELQVVDGPHMYNWVFNRVKFIIGEDFDLRGRDLIKKKGYNFPTNPLPPSVIKRTNQFAGVVIMSNVGAELYLTGKLEKVLKGLRLNRNEVMATSPRVGILQVGAGLFSEKLMINKNQDSEANKIKRLGTIFHEARHSDGHSEHVGFIHSDCPTGHALSGFAACESYANGAYSLEAAAIKNFLLSCESCSIEDRTKLTANIADALGRVVLRSHVKTEAQLLEEMKSFKGVIDFYEDYILKNSKTSSVYVLELNKYKAKYKESESQLSELKTSVIAKVMDPKPEGAFIEIPVSETSKLMKSSSAK